MARTADAYCSQGDLLIGDVTLGTAYSKEEYIDAAADEMDSYIGQRYEIPIDVATSTGSTTVTKLILKRINAHLASGRLLMAAASASQDGDLHAYGAYLVRQAELDLVAIRDGFLPLEGDSIVTVADIGRDDGPTISNRDELSGVETFYDNFSAGYMWQPGSTS